MKQTSEAAIETAIEAVLLADGYQALRSSAFTFLRHLAIPAGCRVSNRRHCRHAIFNSRYSSEQQFPAGAFR